MGVQRVLLMTNAFLMTISVMTLSCDANKPNIVFIMVDDMGWNDVSFHGSNQFYTPNIDLLAYSGVGLQRYYSHAICTPSRTALLTGKYSHRSGMQGFPLTMSENRGIPTDIKLMPEYFKDAGYLTHLVGKWHVGASRKEYLPMSRGFDSHFGHRGGFIDYYEYLYEETVNPYGNVAGLALFDNMTAAWDVEGYITDVYTEHATSIIKDHDTSSPLFLMVAHNAPHAGTEGAPLQAPPDVVRDMRHVELPGRRMLAAMVKKVDDSVGDIFEALYEKGIIENTIIVFASDNGGMTTGMYANSASNYPLRGIKMSPYEGGVRVVGLLWSAQLNNTSHYWDGYMHVSDWLPTLLSAAGVKPPSNITGIDHWSSINTNSPSKRTTLYEIDDYTGYASVTHGAYKLITGDVPLGTSTYQGGELRGVIGNTSCYIDAILESSVHEVLDLVGLTFDMYDLNLRKNMTIECRKPSSDMCYPGNGTVCLYNIIEDPCETTDISGSHPDLVSTMHVLLQEEAAKRIPRVVPTYRDPLAIPSRHNNTWDYWITSESTTTFRGLTLDIGFGGLRATSYGTLPNCLWILPLSVPLFDYCFSVKCSVF